MLHLVCDLRGQEGGQDIVGPEELQSLEADHHEDHEQARPQEYIGLLGSE